MDRFNALAAVAFAVTSLVTADAGVAMGRQSSPSTAASELPRARLHHIHMNSVDPEGAVRFYTSRFKSTAGRFNAQPALSVNGMWFLFNKVQQPPLAEPLSGFWHIGWGSPDMNGTYESLLKSGTKFQTPLTNAGEFLQGKRGPLDFMYAYGPGGEWIELYTTDNIEFHHVHLMCANPAATQAWYLKYFGTPNGVPRRGPTGIWVGDLNLITAGTDAPIVPPVAKGLTTFVSPRGRVLDHFAFAVQNLDHTLARLEADGVTVLDRPKVILGGTLRSSFVQAPDNVQLELVEELKKN